MKKVSFLLSLLLIAAFVLTACGSSADDSDATPGVDMTPGAGEVVTEPTTAVDLEATPTVGTEPTVAPTEPPVVETPVATEAPADGTPQANVPVTGDDDCNPMTVQGLLDMEVFDAQGNQFGDVDSVIVLRDASLVQMDANAVDNGNAVDTTPAAGDVAVTPVAGAAEDAPAANFEAGVAPQIAYVVVDVENEDGEAVIPFSAFDLTVRDHESANVGETGNDVAGTPAAGEAAVTPVAGAAEDVANEVDACAITVNNVQADAAGELPMINLDELDVTADNWDEQFRTYWTDQGVNVPVTGENNLGAPVLLNDQWDAVDAENANGDDLGEVEDFFYSQDGTFQYAILTAGGFLGIGEKVVPVPMSMVQWTAREGDDSIDDVGVIYINITEEDWQNAPSFDSIDEIDNTVDGWDTDIQSYWNNLTPPTE